jgi:hypothetical protein
MLDKITIDGKIKFEPIDRTRKHREQASWKRIAMVIFDGDVTDYYAWFIRKRYNLELNKPLRGAHISFINDSIRDLSQNGKKDITEVDSLWNSSKIKWDNQTVQITLLLNPRFKKEYWWFNLDEESKKNLNGIRAELGLGKPFFDLHMTIGYANEKNSFHNEYIKNGIINGFIW